uniref:Sulfatase-modifying factor enzyme-like domain-containing protein n=1 Tax=Chrysotila carterae TaxID=13221 RepID=A0A7S4C2B5_CHRCT
MAAALLCLMYFTLLHGPVLDTAAECPEAFNDLPLPDGKTEPSCGCSAGLNRQTPSATATESTSSCAGDSECPITASSLKDDFSVQHGRKIDSSVGIGKDTVPERAPRLIWVSGGEFFMGHNNRSVSPSTFVVDGEGPRRRVRLRSFWLEETEVSNRHWAAFVAATGFESESERFGWSFVFEKQLTPEANRKADSAVQAVPWWVRVDGATWLYPDGPGSYALAPDRADHPVVHVSWNDAVAFCKWAHEGGRLPTEAEWEFAALAGSRKRYPWGSRLTPSGQHRANIWQGRFPTQNTADDGFAATAPVKAFGPQNSLGFYNMIGNVWEWVSDVWSTVHTRPATGTALQDPQGPSAGDERTKKGGSYLCHKSYCFRYRVQARSQNTPDTGTSNLGFRCAASVSDE